MTCPCFTAASIDAANVPFGTCPNPNDQTVEQTACETGVNTTTVVQTICVDMTTNPPNRFSAQEVSVDPGLCKILINGGGGVAAVINSQAEQDACREEILASQTWANECP